MAEVIFVVGANGTIGRQLVRQLGAAGRQVRAGVRSRAKAAGLAADTVEVVEADTAHPAPLARAMAGCDAVFIVNPLAQEMVAQCATIVKAAKDAGVRRLVRSSFLGADAPGPILLNRWHRAAEEVIEDSGLPFTHLRPNSFMQNFCTMHGRSIKTKDVFFTSLGVGKTSYVDVRDIAAAAVVALTQPGHENKGYTLTGPEALSCDEAGRVLSGALGRPIAHVDVPETATRRALLEVGAPPVIADALMQLFAVIKAGAHAAVTADVERLLGRPPISFAQFAKDCSGVFELVV
jgi:uncharacterized protein YbjT (DUF2867 family)